MSNERTQIINEFLNGGINRRTFIRRAVAAGISAPIVAGLLTSMPAAVSAQDATPEGPQTSEPRPDADPAPDDQQVFRVAIAGPFRMDPPANTAGLWALQSLVFQGLARVDGSEIVPGVADTWEANEDLTSWTFHLNPNAMFSDGTPITADDVKWTWEWFSRPVSASVGSDRIANTIVGYEAVRAEETDTLEGIVVVDPQTVTFNLTATDPVFLAKSASYNTAVLKKDNVESGGAIHPCDTVCA